MDESTLENHTLIIWNEKLAADLKIRVQATGIPPGKLLREQNDIPEGLDKNVLLSLLKGDNVKIPASYTEFLYMLCRKEVKDGANRRVRKDYVEIPQKKRQKISSEGIRTGVSIPKLLRLAKLDHINSKSIMSIATGNNVKGLEKDVDDVIIAYSKLKNSSVKKPGLGKNKDNRPLRSADLKWLLRVRDFTQILPGRIFEHCDNPPAFLKPQTISGWLNKGNNAKPTDVGWVIASSKELIQRALNGYEDLDVTALQDDNSPQSIREEEREWLMKVRNLTGILPRLVIEHSPEAPDHLSPAIISNWLNANCKARPNDVKWVLRACEAVLEKTLDILKASDSD